MITTIHRKIVLLICCATAAATSQAQNTTPPAASSDATRNGDDVITLSEFSVSAGSDKSYMPQESTSGTRLNSKVKDLPYSVSTLTSEFLRDFSVFEATEELSYMSSVSGVDDGGNVNLRGFNGGANFLRNGLASNGLIDASSIDRIEVVKGPAAAIYGATQPGGSMVISTKRPTNVARQNFTFTAGSYSLSQVQAHLSGPIRRGEAPSTLFYRFDGQYYHRMFEVPGLASTTRSGTITLLFRPNNNTAVTVDAGYLLKLNNSFGGLPWNYDAATKRYTGGYAYEVVRKRILNPSDQKPRWNAVFEGVVEHRFNSVLSGKLAASVSHRTLVNYQSFGGSQYDPKLRKIVDGRTSISYAKDDFDYRNGAADLTAAFPIGSTKHRTLLTADYSLQNRRGFSTTSTAAFNAAHPTLTNAQKDVDSAAAIIPFQPVSIAAKGGPSFNPLSYARENMVLSAGFFIRHEATLWDRLILATGYRHDYVRADLREVSAGRQRKLHDINDTTLLGVTYRITPQISWYAGRNESFSPFSITTSADPTAKPPVPTTGQSYETGVKGELFNGRLGFTANAYDTRRKNEQVTEIDVATGVPFTTYIGNTKTRGAELDLNYRLTDKFQDLLSYAYVDARAVNQGRDTDAENRHTKGAPRHSLSNAIRYQVLSSLSLTVGVRYTAATPAFNPTEGGTFDRVTGAFVSHNGARDVYVPSATIWTAGGTYSWKTQRYARLNHTLTITAKNLTDRLYVVPGNNRTVGDRLGVYATYSITH